MARIPGKPSVLSYHYRFIFSRGKTRSFKLSIDDKSLTLVPKQSRALPADVAVTPQDCGKCSVPGARTKTCRAAAALAEIVDRFTGYDSCRPVLLQVSTDTRMYSKHTTLEDALSSLLWLVIVTSGCPVTGRLKPLVRFHLPTVTPEEMKFRMLSLHIAAQYFVLLKGKKADWKLTGMKKFFTDFSAVVRSLRVLFQPVAKTNAVPNALTRLDCLAVNVALLNQRGLLEDMSAVFAPYLKKR